MSELPKDGQIEENFKGELEFIQKHIESTLERKELAQGYTKNKTRIFICPIDSEMAVYAWNGENFSESWGGGLMPESTVKMVENIITQKPDHIIAILSLLYEEEGSSDRAWYVCSSPINEVLDNYKKNHIKLKF